MSDGNRAPAEQLRAMFDRIAAAYDPMNSLISGFQEPRWRRRVVHEAGLQPGMRALDVACGTGKLTAELAMAVSPGGEAVGVDFSDRMLAIARGRHARRANLRFVAGDALALPFEDRSFDAATIAFGMRNLGDYARGFDELRRVVRPGGRIVCLEIARPASLPGRLAAVWFDRAVPLIGGFAGHRAAYAYLVHSVRDYPPPERVAKLMAAGGLAEVRWYRLWPGLVTIHVGVR